MSNSERHILSRLLEGVQQDEIPVERDADDLDLDEASFEAGGHVYKCAFGRYSCDGEPISRDDYFAAKEGNPSGGSSKSKSEPVDNKSSAKFGHTYEDVLGTKASEYGPDDSEWDDENYETLASYYAASKGLDCDVDDVQSITEEDTLYKNFNYIAQELGWDESWVDHDYDNISSKKFTNPKNGDTFILSNNGMGYQTYEVGGTKAFDPTKYTKDLSNEDLDDYRW